MRKWIFATVLSSLSLTSIAQDSQPGATAFSPNFIIKWAPTGLVAGSLSVQSEYALGKHSSLTAKIGLPIAAKYSTVYDGDDIAFQLKATSFMAGYRIYLSKQQFKGVYFEPFFKYVHHIAEGEGNSILAARKVIMNLTNNYNAYGVGAQLGAQFRIAKRVVIDLFLIGPEINSAKNNFKATELSNTIPWTYIEAQDAERQVKDFIDDQPFIKNKTTVTVNKENKTVMADFKGALPGFRTGISFGIAF